MNHKSLKIFDEHIAIYHHQLRLVNPWSFQIFDLKPKFEKPAYFHNKTQCKYCSFFSISLKSFSPTGNSTLS